jgi:3-dehydroquinate synthase
LLPEYIHITEDAAQAIKGFIEDGHFTKVFVLIDENTERHCLPKIISSLPADHIVIPVQSGESHKTLDTCRGIWEVLTNSNADRHALMINLGGGVITDMGGFCAATYKRGIGFINIPTTLLAQVDASIGGKLGIDFHGFKNHIGLFQIPNKVIVDPGFLRTLPVEELRSGFAEVIKHNLIADKVQYTVLKNIKFDAMEWQEWIAHSLLIKNRIVEADPKEAGERKLLNFGHTIGHAIESFYLDSDRHLRHGEAIAIGMIAEAFLSKEKTGLSDQELDEITEHIRRVYPLKSIPESDFPAIQQLALQDKKNSEAQIKCVLLEATGSAVYDVVIDADDIEVALKYYNQMK